jgi:tetratricopeptide (TPR) repeat protein
VLAQESPPAKPSEPNDPCEARFLEIQKVLQSIPEKLGSIQPEQADSLALRVEGVKPACRQFLANCSKSEKTPLVRFSYVKFLYILSRREREAATLDPRAKVRGQFQPKVLDELMTPYYKEVMQHAELASKTLPEDSKHLPECLEILGWAYSSAREYAKARDTYQQFLDKYPEHPDLGSATSALGRVHLDLKSYDKGIDLLQKALRNPKTYDSTHYPHLHETLWKLLLAKGDIEGLKTSAENVLVVYPLRLQAKALDAEGRKYFEHFLDISGFRKPYAIFALGRLEEARRGFLEHIQALDAKENRLLAEQKTMDPVGRIYRDRSKKCVEFIEELAEKPAPSDFDLDSYWATPNRMTLAKGKGKVFGLVFRGVNDERSREFTQAVDAFADADPDVELVTVSYLKGETNVDEQLELMQRELEEIGYKGSAGFDPDAKNKEIFRAYQAFVGSATFIAINRRGEPVWYQQDPRDIDVQFACAILKRLARK